MRNVPRDVQAVYILADEYKMLTYPDIIIRLLMELFEALPENLSLLDRLRRKESPSRKCIDELRLLLDLAEETEIVEDAKSSRQRSSVLGVSGRTGSDAGLSTQSDISLGRTSSFKEQKLEKLERHLKDYKNALISATEAMNISRINVLIDDFYLMPSEWQPNIIDYLHRLLRDSNYYLKIATIRHRTSLIRNAPQTIGVELFQDVEEISLDRTLEDLESTQEYLSKMLGSLGRKAGIQDLVTENFNPDALQAMTLASGGVPR